jgi:hypothetical protein
LEETAKERPENFLGASHRWRPIRSLAIGETEFVNDFTNAEARFGTTGLA